MTMPLHPLEFFSALVWLDGKPLLDTIEQYRRDIFTRALYTFDDLGNPAINLVLCGRAKKNWKSSDLILAGLYRLLVWPSPQGNDGFILANDEGQANDDLSLAKKLIAVNPVLAREVTVAAKAIVRNDGKGSLSILPAKDVVGLHGKTAIFIGFDEIHGYRNHDLFEALAMDPSRLDALMWITSYSGIRHAPGIPLYDFMSAGKRGDDPRMLFSWYDAGYSTDPAFADKSPEERANPSMASWNNPGYLAQQRRRLPTHKYRRLHLNLPGAPDGAAYSADAVMAAIVPGRKRLPPEPHIAYHAFVDMSGGSSDSAVLGISFYDENAKRAVLACLVSQTGAPPFNPRQAVRKFAAVCGEYNCTRLQMDAYAGLTFRQDFEELNIAAEVCAETKSELYDAFEPRLNAGEVELLDVPVLQEELLTLVRRGSKTDHQNGDHDDHANACVGAIRMASPEAELGALDFSNVDLQYEAGNPFGREIFSNVH